jgi:poly-D-alanine transfer protein DltD
MQMRMMILVASLMVLAGCARTSVYVLEQKELIRVKAGQTITTGWDGWVLSDRAVNRVMNTKIKSLINE